MRKFTSHPAPAVVQDETDDEQPEAASAEEAYRFDFELDDEVFTCELRIDADALIEWSEFAEAVLYSDIDSESPEGVALTAKLLRLALPRPEYRRFRSHLRREHTLPETLLDVLKNINEEMEEAVRLRTAGRPTVPPSRSSHGDSPSAGRVSKVISLQAGDVTVVPMPEPQDHKPKTTRGAGRKKAAGSGG